MDFDSVRLTEVSRHFGRRRALSKVSLTLNAGDIVGLLGPNGAGKSTLIGVLATLVTVSSGEVRYGQQTAREGGADLRQRIGLLAHELHLYGELTARQNLAFFASLYGLDTGTSIDSALTRAAQRGVTVRVLLDAIGGHDGLVHLGPALRAAGVEVIAAMPLRLWGPNAARLDLRNHRKIAVIDGEVAYFGSQNIVGDDANPGLRNEELAVRATGPIVRHLDAVLLADRFLETGTLPPEADMSKPWPVESGCGGLAQVLPSGPGYAEGTAEAVMIALMYGAARRVVLTAPYVVPSPAFLAAMCTAAKRGVTVELIVDRTSNKPLVQLAQASYYDEMLASGVRILEHEGSFLHAKHMSIDDDTVLIGSSNLDIRSFALNAEVSVLIRDAAVAADLHAIQAAYLARVMEVTPATRAALRRGRRVLENLARLMDAVL